MRKLQSMLALMLIAVLCVPAAWAEGQIATDLSGEFVNELSGEQLADAVEVMYEQQTDPLDAEVRIGYVAAEGASVNPFRCNERDLVCANQLVFESLVALDETQKPSPMLADNWTHQGKEWVFTLRSNITFHNGAALTAYDAEASFDAFIASTYANPYTARMKLLIADVMAVDERTLAVTSRFEGMITLYGMDFPIVHASTIQDDLPRGTGPYWYTFYEVDHVLRIEANPLWWKQQPTVATIALRWYPESGNAVEGLQTDEIDMVSTRSSSAALSRKLSNLTAMDYGTTTYEMLVPNLGSSSVMSDINVRKAVMYAIDRAVLASNAYLDMAIQSEVPVLPGTWLYESQSAVYYHSPERALQYLYESGWADLDGDMILNKLNGIQVEELTVRIITYNDASSSIRENAAAMIAGYLNAVGIKTQVSVLSKSRVKDRMDDREYDLALIGVNLSEIPVLQPLLASDGALNFSRYSDDWMDGWISQTSSAGDEARMKKLYSDIQLKVVDELPVMGLLFRTGTVLSSRSLGGLTGIRSMHAFRGLEYLNN